MDVAGQLVGGGPLMSCISKSKGRSIEYDLDVQARRFVSSLHLACADLRMRGGTVDVQNEKAMTATSNCGEEGGLSAGLLPGLTGNAVLWAMQSGFQSDLHASSTALILATTGPACSCSSIPLPRWNLFLLPTSLCYNMHPFSSTLPPSFLCCSSLFSSSVLLPVT